jgi:hypothetical protein
LQKLLFPFIFGGNAPLQSLTGKYRGLQGNPCNENRDPVMRTGVPCNENRFFPVKKTYREFLVSLTGFGFAVWFKLNFVVAYEISFEQFRVFS